MTKKTNQYKQPIAEIEKHYEVKDPWFYESTPDDQVRKDKILETLKGRTYKRALDIGGGEGWISKDLPAESIEVYEVSENARKRLPEGILGVTEATGKYDLIVGTGIFYQHYDYEKFLDIIKNHSSGNVLLCNIDSWIVDEVYERLGQPSTRETFPYREFTQRLEFYENI